MASLEPLSITYPRHAIEGASCCSGICSMGGPTVGLQYLFAAATVGFVSSHVSWNKTNVLSSRHHTQGYYVQAWRTSYATIKQRAFWARPTHLTCSRVEAWISNWFLVLYPPIFVALVAERCGLGRRGNATWQWHLRLRFLRHVVKQRAQILLFPLVCVIY